MILLDEQPKVTTAELDYRISLSGGTISTATWSGGGLTIATTATGSTTATARITGGIAGTRYDVTCHVVLTDGREYTFLLRILAVSRIVVKEVIKAPDDVLQLGAINWTAVLGTDTIASRAWAVSSGITIDGGTTSSTVKVDGGTAGADYYATETITTTAGQIDARAYAVWVRSV